MERYLFILAFLVFISSCKQQESSADKATVQKWYTTALDFFVKKDYVEALKWYKQAAYSGDLNAQFNLGMMHENGLGTDVNYKMALS